MQEVADEAGISRGMLYLAFASKEHLLAAVLAAEIQAYVATLPPTSPRVLHLLRSTHARLNHHLRHAG